jgi:threonine dehydrogenase-like Zn-dependent dehydrogenase
MILASGITPPPHGGRLAWPNPLGAHATIDIDNEDLSARVADLTGGEMPSLVIDCASGGPRSVVSAIALARKRGRVILGGQKRQKVPEFDSDMVIAKFLTVKGMRGHSYESVELALGMIARNENNVRELSTHVFGLGEVDLALKTLVGEGAEAAIHCTVDPWRE